MHAAFIAIGMEADVFVYDTNIDRLRDLDIAFGGRARRSSRRSSRSRSGCRRWTS
jgi:alanine dehydrogenase